MFRDRQRSFAPVRHRDTYRTNRSREVARQKAPQAASVCTKEAMTRQGCVPRKGCCASTRCARVMLDRKNVRARLGKGKTVPGSIPGYLGKGTRLGRRCWSIL